MSFWIFLLIFIGISEMASLFLRLVAYLERPAKKRRAI